MVMTFVTLLFIQLYATLYPFLLFFFPSCLCIFHKMSNKNILKIKEHTKICFRFRKIEHIP